MKKDLSYYLDLGWPIKFIEKTDKGKIYYEVEIPILPGCYVRGKTEKEVRYGLIRKLRRWLEDDIERGLNIPEPEREKAR